MAVIAVRTVFPVLHAARSNIDLTADYRLNPRLAARLIKGDRAVHNAVVGYCQRLLSEAFSIFRHLVNAARAIKQAVFTMDMKVDKRHFSISLSG